MNTSIVAKNDIEFLANKLLEDCNAFNGYTRVIEIANKLGLQVISATFKDSSISGMLIFNDDEHNIYINTTNSIVRQRFTIAHEIGHYVLHNNIIEKQKGNVFYRDQMHSNETIETQANSFAAALLMPAARVKDDWQIINNIVILASQYRVSVETAKIRLGSLRLI